MNTFIFIVQDPELQGFYTGITITAAISLVCMGLFYAEVPQGRWVSIVVCILVPTAFIAAHAFLHIPFAKLAYAGLAWFIATVAFNKLMIRRRDRAFEAKREKYRREFENEFR
jgi:hypothetical protein